MRTKSAALALLVMAAMALSLPTSAETIIGGIDMGITKDVDASQASPGDTLVYTLVATNYGEAGAREGYVTDFLPDGVTFVSVDDPACTHDAGVVECYFPLWLPIVLDPVEGVKTIQITVTVDDDATGTLLNLARVENRDPAEGAPEDGDPTNDEDTAETEVILQELGEIGDTVFEDPNGNGVQDPGEPGIPGVGVQIIGAGGGGAEIVLTDANGMYLFTGLPANDYAVTVVDSTLPSGFAYTTASQFDIPLADGESFLDADFGINFPDEPIIDLEVSKTVTVAPLFVGDPATFEITVTNQGPDDATGVVVQDTIPTELEIVSVSVPVSAVGPPVSGDDVGCCVTLTWDIGDLAAGATATLRLDVIVNAAGLFTNTAEVTAADQPDVDSTPGDGEGDDYDEADVPAADVLPTGSIGDTVYLDSNNNGVQDSGEPGISGATVTLSSTAGTQTDVTDSSGTYLFVGLPAGDYTVTVDQTTVDSNLGITTASSFLVTLVDAQIFLDADFGFTPILPPTGFAGDMLAPLGLVLLAFGALALRLPRRVREL